MGWALKALIAVGVLFVAAVVAFAVAGGLYRAPSESMEPTIRLGDRFTVVRFGAPEVGDVIVFHPPAGAEARIGGMCGGGVPPAGQMCAKPTPRRADVEFVKRVVAEGGDEISMRDGRIVRNGRPETANAPRPCEVDQCQFPEPITIPDGHLFMLGDNRGASDDSRFWGPVPEDWVVGRYWFRIP